MTTIAEIFILAQQLHQAGRFRQAEPLYRQILQADHYHADAHHLLGVCSFQSGCLEEAVASIGRALALKPEVPFYYLNLGLVYQALNKTAEAIATYEQALRLEPRSAEAHGVLGHLLRSARIHWPAISNQC